MTNTPVGEEALSVSGSLPCTFGQWLLFAVILAANISMLDNYRRAVPQDRTLMVQDFLGYYTAAKLPRHEMYDIDRQKEVQTALLGKPYDLPSKVLLFNHPPVLIPLVNLISTDDYLKSYWRWAVVLSTICLLCAGAVYLLLRDAGQPTSTASLAAFTALLFYPLYRSVQAGQDTPFVLVGALIWALCLTRKRDGAAGLALALTIIKPQLAIPLAAATFAASRRSFAWFAAAAAGLTALSVLYVGAGGALTLVEDIRLSADGEAFGVFFTRQYNFAGLLARLGAGKTVAGVAGWCAFAAAVVCLALRRRGASDPPRLGLAVIVSIFFSPNLHFHDIALLLLPMAMLARGLKARYAPLVFVPLSPVIILAVGWTLAAYCMQAAYAFALARCKAFNARS